MEDTWKEVIEQVVVKVQTDLVQNKKSGLVEMLRQEKLQSVKQLYNYLKRVPSIDMTPFGAHLNSFVDLRI